jgi:hypothetical protein
MNRRLSPIVVTFAALLAGCPPASPSGSGSDRLPMGAAAPAPTYPKGTPLPGYESVKVNEIYVFDLPFHSYRWDTIKARGEDDLVIERTTILGGQQQDPQTIHEPLVSSGRPIHPGVELAPDFKKVAEDRLVVSGRIFECDVFEANGGGQKVRYWIANRFPFLVRSKANDTTTISLKEVFDHMPDGPPPPKGMPPGTQVFEKPPVEPVEPQEPAK